jgi:hypothetical protein
MRIDHEAPPRAQARPAAIDPLFAEAAAEVDRGLLRWALAMSPRARLRACTQATRALARFRVSPGAG